MSDGRPSWWSGPWPIRSGTSPYDLLEFREAENAHLRAENERLREAGNRLAVAAMTTGGTAGRDEGLVEAVEAWTAARGIDP